ncbi:lysylphosphatidylglycerol synthase domain-containing protein [Thermaurantiacus sp.]
MAGALLVVVIAATALGHLLRELNWAEVGTALGQISAGQFLAALVLTALSYLLLAGYDLLALAAMGQQLPWWRCALGAFSAYSFSHNLGFAPITAGAARWRAYAGTGLSAADIARIVVIAGVTYWLGIFLLLGLFLITHRGALRIDDMTVSHPLQVMLGALVLGAILLYLFACTRQRGPLTLLGWRLPVPTLPQALLQFLLAAADIALASAALLVLLPTHVWGHYPQLLVAYVVAVVVALITHAPGGLGVFEAVMLVTLPAIDRPELVSALLLYRLIYYWLPFGTAVLLLGGREALRFRATPFTPHKELPD